MTWRVLYLRPASQLRVSRAIAEVAIATGEALEVYYPRERVWSGQGVRRRPCERPLLPSMLFVHAADSAVPHLMELDGVWRRLDPQSAGHASAMDDFIRSLRFSEEHRAFDKTLRRTVRLKIGQEVKISAGPYAGFMATIIGLNRAGRAKLVASVFGQSRRLSAEVGLLEPMDDEAQDVAPLRAA